jgi:3-oxoacyl-[acyl-carrier protein] reductase
MMKLKDRVAIVTGAGRGIGRAITLALAKEGANVAVVSRTFSEVKEVAIEVEASGQRSLAIKADVSSKEEVEAMVKSVVGELGEVDILVNNAGIQGPIGLIVENDIEQWIKTIHINLIGTVLCTKAVLPNMVEHRQGKIINLSGGGATSPRPRFSAYAASKAAVVRFTETVAEEMKEFNIQVNAIAPGAVNTRLLQEVLAAGEAAGDKALNEAKHQLETGGTPAEVAAELALFLASEESNGLTGRLISAVWDDWQDLPEQVERIMASDLYTLRRIVG